MELTVFIILATLFVAYTNGANDNFKGVATLFGSGTTDYRKALTWGTVTTFAGSVTAFFLAEKLVKTFSGKGLVPDTLIATPEFLLAVALGASVTVLLATLTGIPISTTHSLIGSLAGAGFMAIGPALGFSTLGKDFFVPLISSPLVAVILTAVVYIGFRQAREMLKVTRSTCVCVGERIIPVVNARLINGQTLTVSQLLTSAQVMEPHNLENGGRDTALACLQGYSEEARTVPLSSIKTLRKSGADDHNVSLFLRKSVKAMDILVDEKSQCQAKAIERYDGRLLGIEAQQILDALHFLSAGAVSFARGLNDTPKIVALAVTAGVLGLKFNIILVAIAMALGGLLSAKRIARTMSHKITAMNHGQGFTANLITALLVIFASKIGVPVSTTHISCGSLFGIGMINGQANWKVVGAIVSAWVLTLPMAALLSAGCYFVLKGL